MRLIADEGLLQVLRHCCAPVLCIAIRSEVKFSCCARFTGHAISQGLCTWSTDQPLENLACMLAAARAFCVEASKVWASARQAATAQGRMRPPPTIKDARRTEALLPGVLPPWLKGYCKSEQLGGLRRNVWLLRLNTSSASATSTGILSGSNTPSAPASSTGILGGGSTLSATAEGISSAPPNILVVKFLEADGDRQELARRSWSVQKAWGLAGCAPRVVSCTSVETRGYRWCP